MLKLYMPWLVFALLLGMASPAPGQSGEQSATAAPRTLAANDIVKLSDAAAERGNELTALDELGKLEAEFINGDRRTYRLVAELSCHFDAVVGDYRGAQRHFAIAFPGTRPALTPEEERSLQGLRPRSALSVLDSALDGVRIVMLNEAHHVPQHRAFAIELLVPLWKKGFRYLAVEAISSKDTELAKRGYPVKGTGYYTDEPVFGDLIRTALRIGYKVLPYEDFSAPDQAGREQGQATNISAIFKADAQAKVLVHAGYDHINESGLLFSAVPMAQQVAKLTGLDPLTIDQTTMTGQPSEDREHPIYRYLMARTPIAEPSIFFDSQGKRWTAQPGVRDITLVHPRSKYVDGRPTWLALGGARRPYKLASDICEPVERCLVKARKVGESADAIPVDAFAVTKDQRSAVLMLPKGEFTLQVQDARGSLLREIKVRQRGR